MAISCKRCERPLLPDDAVCWHCGESVAGGGETAVSPADESRQPQQLRLFAAIGLTLLLLLGSVAYLGRQPRLFISPQTSLGPSWQFATDADQRMAISLPRSWQPQTAVPAVIAEQLTGIAPDAKWHFIHLAPDEASFSLVGESRLLHQETADALLERLAIAGEIFDADQLQSLDGAPTLTTRTIGNGLVCQWQIVRADTDYLLVGCNVPPISQQERETNSKILNSFQQLN